MSDGVFVNVQAEVLYARLAGMQVKLHQSIVTAVTRLSIKLQANVKGKLTGEVLHVRSGNLRQSINRVINDTPDSVIATVGTNVPYAHIHEYGYDGPENVRAHTRRSSKQMALAKFRTLKDGTKVEVKGSYRKAGGGDGEISVKAFVRQMHMPETSFLRSSLSDMEDEIRSTLKQAAIEGLQ